MSVPRFTKVLLALIGAFCISASLYAMPPSEHALQVWKDRGVLEQKQAIWRAFMEAGGDAPEAIPLDKERRAREFALGAQTTDTLRVLVVMVDFSDNVGTAQTYQFDSILFSNVATYPPNMLNPSGSMTDFLLENSYGSLFIKGDVVGWYRLPEPYSYYVDGDNGLSRGPIVALWAAVKAEQAGVDFSRYDKNGDGQIDGFIVIHAGSGAEGSGDGIWSHKSNLSSPVTYDGVTISAYTLNPEDNTGGGLSYIGVFAHEYGHILGMPDLYDVCDASQGIGRWSLMSTGSWNGDGRRPAHFDAWCKLRLGFAYAINVTQNLYQAAIPAVELNPVVYSLGDYDVVPTEMWLVENRQKIGSDLSLPGGGLLVYHIDATASEANCYATGVLHVAVEQADGEFDLENGRNDGDMADPWPGSYNRREFHSFTVPNSNGNQYGSSGDVPTEVAMWNVSNSDSVMHADLDVSYSRPWIELSPTMPTYFDDQSGGDGDSILEAGETADFYFWVINRMRTAYHANIRVSCANPAVHFIQDSAYLNDIMTHYNIGNAEPVVVTVDADAIPTIDTFYVMLYADSLSEVIGTREYSKRFAIEVAIGGPQVLIVDDDRGENYEQVYAHILYEQRVPYEIWNTSAQGHPSGTDLMGYQMVFWHTGDSTHRAIDSLDIAAMKYLMDHNGRLLLSTLSGVIDMAAIDPNFMRDYFGAQATGKAGNFPAFWGVAGNAIGDGTKYRYPGGVPDNAMRRILAPVNGGQAAFYMPSGLDDVVGVTYFDSLTHRAVLLTFPVEYLGDGFAGYQDRAHLISDVIDFFDGVAGIHTDVAPDRPRGLPASFELAQNYPNPFNPTTTIAYTLRPTEGYPPRTELSILNILGQHVITLVDAVQLPGSYQVQWDGTSASGSPVASGIYFYRLTRGSESQTKKMALVR